MRTVTYNCLLLSLLLIKSDGIDYKFVNVIFRHGDRTPQNNSYEIFPTSEYAKYRFDPYGYGQLTNKGKRNAYQLGIDIRDYYSQFLNDLYHPEEISAQSSDADRTKMSLQLVMAGIFPPSSAQSWNCKLNWQPVVTNYIPRDDDYVLNFLKCPNFKKEHDAVKKLPEVVEKVSQYSTFAKQLSEWTGVPITPTKHFVQIYHALTMLDHMGFASPHWSSRFYPEGLLLDGVALDFEILNYNERLRALSGGMVLKKFIDNMVAAADPNSNSRLKMELFSAHEVNIVAILKILGVYEKHFPDYSSAVFVELLKENNEYYVNIDYYLNPSSKRIHLPIPDCEPKCSLKRFIELFKDKLPKAEDMKCKV